LKPWRGLKNNSVSGILNNLKNKKIFFLFFLFLILKIFLKYILKIKIFLFFI